MMKELRVPVVVSTYAQVRSGYTSNGRPTHRHRLARSLSDPGVRSVDILVQAEETSLATTLDELVAAERFFSARDRDAGMYSARLGDERDLVDPRREGILRAELVGRRVPEELHKRSVYGQR
jgi:hypothetical protein